MCDVCAKKVIEGLSKCMQAQAFYHFFVFPFNFFSFASINFAGRSSHYTNVLYSSVIFSYQVNLRMLAFSLIFIIWVFYILINYWYHN